jgi:hypothetical protein
LDRRANLQAIADDSIVCEQGCGFGLVVFGHLAGIEAVERGAIGGAFLQDGDPTQAGLSAFQDEQFEQAAIIVQRHAPFFVVVND